MGIILIIGIILCIIMACFEKKNCNSIYAYIGLFTVIISIIICFATCDNSIYQGDYIESSETLTIKEIKTNQYYETSTDGGKISVFIKNNDGTFKKKSFNEEKVSFIESDTAQCKIITKEYKNSIKNFLFKTFYMGTKETKEIVITIPNDNVKLNNKNEINKTKEQYCSTCGKEVDNNDNFCSSCGGKL